MFEFEFKCESEFKSKSNSENILLAIDKNRVVACICILHPFTLH